MQYIFAFFKVIKGTSVSLLGLTSLLQFILGYMCRITVIFGILKDGSLFINIFASNNSFSYRNIFRNGVHAL